MKKNILVFPSASNLAIEIFYSLSKDKNINLIGCSSCIDNEITKIFKNNVIIKKFIHDINFLNELNKIIKTKKIDLIYPLSDDVSLFLCKNKKRIKCDILSSSSLSTQKLLRSKLKTYEFLKNSISVPTVYYDFKKIKKYPVFIKPQEGNSSKDCYLAKDKQTLNFYHKKIKNPIVMENLPYQEFTVDCFTNYKKELIFVQPRLRINKSLGASSYTKIIDNKILIDMASNINSILDFNGAWFFQAKIDYVGDPKILEISPRIGASSGINRINDVNLPLLNVYNHYKKDVKICSNMLQVIGFRYLNYNFDFSFSSFKNAYIDFDDTLIVNKKINSNLMKYLFDFKNQKIKVFLISKHKGDLIRYLKKIGIYDFFDGIIHLKANENKSDYMMENSFLIDDSFSERNQAREKGFLAFPIESFYSEY